MSEVRTSTIIEKINERIEPEEIVVERWLQEFLVSLRKEENANGGT